MGCVTLSASLTVMVLIVGCIRNSGMEAQLIRFHVLVRGDKIYTQHPGLEAGRNGLRHTMPGTRTNTHKVHNTDYKLWQY